MAENRRNIIKLLKGLFKDSNLQDQPEHTHRFGLNAIMETDHGGNNLLSNEEGNISVTNLSEGFIPVGKKYIGKNRIAILSANEKGQSEIGILYTDSNEYVIFVNENRQPLNTGLNFDPTKPLKITYRLRKGCEDTIYWTGDDNKPRYFNFSKPSLFKGEDGSWDAAKFNLQKTYRKIPTIQSLEVLDSGGNMESGSYNISIQYLDESLNPTEWAITTPVAKIYNSLTNREFREINGSINSDIDYLNFPKTTKALKINLSNLDLDFPFYRIAIIAANNGSGQINDITYTDKISTSKESFIYTGSNGFQKGTIEEIAMFTSIIEKADTIEQIDNMLVLGGTEGSQTNLCALQKYASRIKADCFTKKVILTDVKDIANPRNATQDLIAVGYMPGEIYSFGVVYIFDDHTLSPAYHIPGRNPRLNADTIFSAPVYDVEGNKLTHAMSSVNNTGFTSYIDNAGSCSDSDYWGLDSEGIPLKNTHIRHHRFPLRSEIGKPLVKTVLGDSQVIDYHQLVLRVVGSLKVPIPCPADDEDCTTDVSTPFTIKVSYTVDGSDYFFTQQINPQNFANNEDTFYSLDIYQNSQFHSSNNFTNIVIEETDINGLYKPEYSQWESYFEDEPIYSTTVQLYQSDVQGKICSTEVFGIKFSGVDLPDPEELGGKKVIGYYIVRNERTEFDKTILDSGVLTPCVENNKYISHGLLNPDTNNISKKIFGLIHPEHKFLDKEYVQYDNIIHQGDFNIVDKKLGKVNFDDVYDGSSFDKEGQKDGNDDGESSDGSPTSKGYDGWSFNLITRDNITDFSAQSSFNVGNSQIKDVFYLDALESKSVNDEANDVYNIACDNKIGILELKNENVIPYTKDKLPYVMLYKHNSDPYSNFRTLPYYKENLNPVYFRNEESSECTVFNGDSYVSPMRYVNTIFWDNRIAKRKGRTNAWKIVVGAFLVVLGAVLSVFTGGASAVVIGAGITLMGAGALFVSSGIKTVNFNKAYNEEYDKGLRQTVLDEWVNMFYNYKTGNPFGYTEQTQWAGRQGDGPSDDTIQWIGDCVTDLWFESSINMHLRNHFSEDVSPTYADSPGRIESGNNTPIALWEFFGIIYSNSNQVRYPVSSLERHIVRKLLAFDEKRDDKKYYIGLALGEYYHVNPDYMRKNKEKSFYSLATEYDCCSECREDFPHRWHWSVQSYQEELSDNYRVFLPNNYRDLNGETGVITDMFKIGPELFIHTEEGLWQTIRNQQERITDQIVSFIGTGEYFSIPPRLIVDDDTGMSAGCIHTNATIKTPSGVYFISENESKIHGFNGKQIQVISNAGMSSWFKNNIKLEQDNSYFKIRRKNYPFKNNTAYSYGTGFTTAYDSRKERLLITKKDFAFEDGIFGDTPYELTNYKDRLIVFKDIENTIRNEEVDNWRYIGIKNGVLVFERIINIFIQDKRWSTSTPPEEIYISKNSRKVEYKNIEGETVKNPTLIKKSWTISYSFRAQSWVSYHSYIPGMYLTVADSLYSWIPGDAKIWEHNTLGTYQKFYGKRNPFIVEYVVGTNSVETKIFDFFKFNTEAKRYNTEMENFFEDRFITFNKAILYNSRQSTGLLNLIVKDTVSNKEQYLIQQVKDTNPLDITIDRNERDWSLNQIRDLRIDYNSPIFKKDIKSRQEDYYIDKVLNNESININKPWFEQESFRDKYLVVRLIFDNFEDIKLFLNYSIPDEKESHR